MFLPPLIAWQYRNWRDNQLWLSLELAKQQRDNALIAWRIAYDNHAGGKSPATEKNEAAAQQRYYAARTEVDSVVSALNERYGDSESALVQAMQARRRKK